MLLVAGCDRLFANHRRDNPEPSSVRASASDDRLGAGPIRMETLEPDASLPTFVMRGEPRGEARLVFLHGMCGHGLGYAQSFQFSAARWGTLIAPQGDRVCGSGPWALWSADIVALDARIISAFRALGQKDPIDDIVAMGYSQGATRAEALARKYPERYTRLILMGAPNTVRTAGLRALRGAVMMAGEHDRQDRMKAGVRALTSIGEPCTFMQIPEATHGAMGRTPEETMGEALEWLFKHSKPAERSR
jgi:pimeloyl-ACP methyl ester carboxylesterase